MLDKQTNQVVSITNISESGNSLRVTHAQTNISVPLGSTHVINQVSNNHTDYNKNSFDYIYSVILTKKFSECL